MSSNRVILKGSLQVTETLRHTPAGLPLLHCRLQHNSAQQEAGMERQVACDVDAMAIGEIASRLSQVAPGTKLQVTGFLANTGKRDTRAGSRLILHITQFESFFE